LNFKGVQTFWEKSDKFTKILSLTDLHECEFSWSQLYAIIENFYTCAQRRWGLWGKPVQTATTQRGRVTGGDRQNGIRVRDRVIGGWGQNGFGTLTGGPSPFELFLNFESAPNFEIRNRGLPTVQKLPNFAR
jgi:hypothetical protein